MPFGRAELTTYQTQTRLRGLRPEGPGSDPAAIPFFIQLAVEEAAMITLTFFCVPPKNVHLFVKGKQKATILQRLLPPLDGRTAIVRDLEEDPFNCPSYQDLGLRDVSRSTIDKASALTEWMRRRLFKYTPLHTFEDIDL